MVEEQAPTTAKAKRAVKIPKNATLALNALRDAVADCGQRAANAHVPAGANVVDARSVARLRLAPRPGRR